MKRLISPSDMPILNTPILQPIPLIDETKSYWNRVWDCINSRREFRVVRNWDFQLPNGRPKIRIPKDFIFDGPSIPRLFWWILSPVGLLLIPALIHDYAYEHNKLIEIKDGEEQDFSVKDKPKQYWDALFLDVAIQVNGKFFILWVAWLLLAVFGWAVWWEHRDLEIRSRLACWATNLAIIFMIGGGVYILIILINQIIQKIPIF